MQQPKLIELPKFADPRGNLTFLQQPDQIPFAIKRVFWLYDVPGGDSRGGHAYRQQHEIIIALSGSFDVVITKEDHTTQTVHLNRSYFGLWVPPLTWRHIENFSTNSLGLHISSSSFDAKDYIREFDEYIQLNLES
ncbi:MAG: WxcM-like domain-containing protein [Chitinophagaceae bacterium]|nr:WxcM-like domain-containing protein [Chitinophagaceae bacterium]